MTVPDRLRRIQEIYSESSSFAINQSLPQTVIGQCIVSYRKFVDCIRSSYGVDAFDVLTPVDTCIIMKPTFKGREVFGVRTSCLSIIGAIKVARYALKHSRHDFLSVNIIVFGTSVGFPIISYAAESKKPHGEFCKILEFKRAQANHQQI
jgi:hypothetical protein